MDKYAVDHDKQYLRFFQTWINIHKQATCKKVGDTLSVEILADTKRGKF